MVHTNSHLPCPTKRLRPLWNCRLPKPAACDSKIPKPCLQGLLRGEDLSAAYASGDVFMMPSESETLGFVALEAMASGLPVVAVAAGGLTDILTNPGVTGGPPWYACQQLHQQM